MMQSPSPALPVAPPAFVRLHDGMLIPYPISWDDTAIFPDGYPYATNTFSMKLGLVFRNGILAMIPAKSELCRLCPFLIDDQEVHCTVFASPTRDVEFLKHTLRPLLRPCSRYGRPLNFVSTWTPLAPQTVLVFPVTNHIRDLYAVAKFHAARAWREGRVFGPFQDFARNHSAPLHISISPRLFRDTGIEFSEPDYAALFAEAGPPQTPVPGFVVPPSPSLCLAPSDTEQASAAASPAPVEIQMSPLN